MTESEPRYRYKFKVLGHHAGELDFSEPQITFTFLAGPDDSLVYCGTLTMAEAEWEVFKGVLARALKDDLEIEDTKPVR